MVRHVGRSSPQRKKKVEIDEDFGVSAPKYPTKQTILPLDNQTECLLRSLATGHQYFLSDIGRLPGAEGDLSRLVRMGLVAVTDIHGAYNRKTARVEDRYQITKKGLDAVGGKTGSAPAGIKAGREASRYSGGAVTIFGQAKYEHEAEDMIDLLVRSGRIKYARDVQVVPAKKVAGADLSKGFLAIVPAGEVYEAYQNGANSSVMDDDDHENAQAQPAQAPTAAPAPGGAPTPAPTAGSQATPPQSTQSQAPAQPQAPAAPPAQDQPAPAAPAPGTPAPTQAQPAPAQPNPADAVTAQQIANKLKSSPNYDPTQIDANVQKDLVAMGKPTQDTAAMSAMVKKQLGVAESYRAKGK